jgi:radical SAM protein with 4Fe4S-binding SPASM domain
MISRDSLEIAQKLSFPRLWNVFLLRSSFVMGKYFKLPVVWGTPYAASIEPTTACNLGCPECPSGLKQFTRETGRLPVEENKNMLDQIGRNLFYINYYFQGEPFLNPQFLELIKEAHSRKIYTATSTNAHFISEKKAGEIIESGLSRLIISIDGITQETYVDYRIHGQLDKVLRGTKAVMQAKKERKSKTPHVIWQFLVTGKNEHEIEQLQELAREYEVDELRLKSIQVYEFENGNPLIPQNEKYSRYKRLPNGKYKMKAGLGNHCWRMWSSTVLTWNGIVVPCCFDKDAKHQLGKISDSNFKSIWKSERYKSLRKQILTARQDVDICNNCSEGSKVWV